MRIRILTTPLYIVLCAALPAPMLAQHINAADAPCHGSTTLDGTNCFYAAAKKADVELNNVYRRITAKLATNERVLLQTAQRHWLGYREANCTAEREVYEGGSASSMVYAACLEADTRERIKELKLMYDWVPSRQAKSVSP